MPEQASQPTEGPLCREVNDKFNDPFDVLILTWDSNNDNSHSNNQNINKLFALLRRARIGMIGEIGDESEQQDEEQNDSSTMCQIVSSL